MARTESRLGAWVFGLGTGAVAAFLLGPALAHFRILPAMAGFRVFAFGGLLGMVTLVTGLLAAARGLGAGRGLGFGAAVTAASLLIAVPARKFPPINDITTDVENPPRFVAAGALTANRGRDMRYAGPSFAAQQRAGYPSLTGLRLDVAADEAFRRVQTAVRQMPNWELTRSDAAAHALEGVATSHVFRFQDDFVVEVRPQDGASVVHMRSKSRDGRGDIGANAARIEAFFARLQR